MPERFDEPSRGPKEDLPIGDLSSTAESDQEFEVGGDLINGSWHRDVCERGRSLCWAVPTSSLAKMLANCLMCSANGA